MNLAFFLEEPSAREMLKGLLPRLLPSQVGVYYVVFEGKQDLERNLTRKLLRWQRPDTVFLILQDQDSSDCRELKERLTRKCKAAGRRATVRVVCRELESWYFGDLAAVEHGLRIDNLQRFGRNRQYREPDSIVSPSRELKKITRDVYQKLAGSRAIGAHLSLCSNTSHSFRVFVSAIRHLAGARGAPS